MFCASLIDFFKYISYLFLNIRFPLWNEYSYPSTIATVENYLT